MLRIQKLGPQKIMIVADLHFSTFLLIFLLIFIPLVIFISVLISISLLIFVSHVSYDFYDLTSDSPNVKTKQPCYA